MPGSRPRYTRELYDALVRGFREAPGQPTVASRIAGCSRSTAAKAWDFGWPKRSWAPPIKDYLAQEAEKIRAERFRLAEEKRKHEHREREKTLQDAIKTGAQEAQASAQARANALGVANVIGRVVVGCIPLADRVSAMLKDPDTKWTPQQAMKVFASMAYVVRQGSEAIKLALEVERIRTGEPVAVLGLQIEDMSAEDAITELEGLARTLSRVRPNGTLAEIDAPEDGQLH